MNAGRRRRGLPTLDVLTTKWAGRRGPLPAFEARTGLRGASVASTPLYAGLARLLAMAAEVVPHRRDSGKDMAARIDAARRRIAAGDTLDIDPHWLESFPAAGADTEPSRTLAEVERRTILDALERCRGKIYGPGGAAAALGLKPTTLYGKMRKHRIAKGKTPS